VLECEFREKLAMQEQNLRAEFRELLAGKHLEHEKKLREVKAELREEVKAREAALEVAEVALEGRVRLEVAEVAQALDAEKERAAKVAERLLRAEENVEQVAERVETVAAESEGRVVRAVKELDTKIEESRVEVIWFFSEGLNFWSLTRSLSLSLCLREQWFSVSPRDSGNTRTGSQCRRSCCRRGARDGHSNSSQKELLPAQQVDTRGSSGSSCESPSHVPISSSRASSC